MVDHNWGHQFRKFACSFALGRPYESLCSSVMWRTQTTRRRSNFQQPFTQRNCLTLDRRVAIITIANTVYCMAHGLTKTETIWLVDYGCAWRLCVIETTYLILVWWRHGPFNIGVYLNNFSWLVQSDPTDTFSKRNFFATAQKMAQSLWCELNNTLLKVFVGAMAIKGEWDSCTLAISLVSKCPDGGSSNAQCLTSLMLLALAKTAKCVCRCWHGFGWKTIVGYHLLTYLAVCSTARKHVTNLEPSKWQKIHDIYYSATWHFRVAHKNGWTSI